MCKQLFRQLPRILKAWRPGFSVLHLLTVINISHRASSKVAPSVQAASFWLIAGVFRHSQHKVYSGWNTSTCSDDFLGLHACSC